MKNAHFLIWHSAPQPFFKRSKDFDSQSSIWVTYEGLKELLGKKFGSPDFNGHETPFTVTKGQRNPIMVVQGCCSRVVRVSLSRVLYLRLANSFHADLERFSLGLILKKIIQSRLDSLRNEWFSLFFMRFYSLKMVDFSSFRVFLGCFQTPPIWATEKYLSAGQTRAHNHVGEFLMWITIQNAIRKS